MTLSLKVILPREVFKETASLQSRQIRKKMVLTYLNFFQPPKIFLQYQTPSV